MLLVPGKGFNWNCPDHFRVVYLPNVRQLEKAMDKLKDFLSTYKQRYEDNKTMAVTDYPFTMPEQKHPLLTLTALIIEGGTDYRTD